ncbi:AraC family transcriptional regulator [Phreatobacter aquaticus]|uniref:AraC family transcriptional regulator n=1 Tax=Phreatobacter aquaticus TaxID=2570229 RepID=A0A4D7QIE9_9HYPH|nr:helix-turn-helix transcriptional regulator [Phreatobacter aquaticus]QCK87188.1 AraC family transcriptional regulator [Phreatobacter aquaticus]
MRRPDPSREIDIDLARRTVLEQASGETVALASDYPGGWRIKRHNHTRGQLMNALDGVVVVVTDAGRWIIPPQYGLWIPAGVFHEVEILGDVKMRSVYVTPGAIDGLPEVVRVVAITDLMRALIIEAVTLPIDPEPTSRAGLVMALMLREIPRLPEQPLGLAMPSDPKLAALCRRFIEAPSPAARIDDWARDLAMSRRAFTRAFRAQTGLSLTEWRQQACLFAALPRLARGEAVTGVAMDLGYESVAAFTTMFRRMLGAPPKRYLSGHDSQDPGRARPASSKIDQTGALRLP